MGFKDQLITLKNNWLIIVLLLVVLGLVFAGGSSGGITGISGLKYATDSSYAMGGMEESMRAPSYYDSYYYDNSDFAPDVQERKITKTSSINTEVNRGKFHETESRLKAIIDSSDSYLLNQNVNKRDSGLKESFYGSYSIKVDTAKYDSIVQQLKEIGDVTYFNENANDITGTYTNIEIELEAEKERLTRYRQMYNEAEKIEDKIDLNDRIFDQERRVKYLEDSLKNMDNRVEYTSIHFSISEKQSSYANVILVKFSELIKALIDSLNFVLKLLFVLVPPAVLLVLIILGVKLVKRIGQ